MKKFWRAIVQQWEHAWHYWTVHLKTVTLGYFMLCVFYNLKKINQKHQYLFSATYTVLSDNSNGAMAALVYVSSSSYHIKQFLKFSQSYCIKYLSHWGMLKISFLTLFWRWLPILRFSALSSHCPYTSLMF